MIDDVFCCFHFCLQVLVNSKPRDMLFKRVSAYVPQEEVFVPTLTALETIAFHARLSLPSNVSAAERLEGIHRVLSIMGLTRVRHTTVRINCPSVSLPPCNPCPRQ